MPSIQAEKYAPVLPAGAQRLKVPAAASRLPSAAKEQGVTPATLPAAPIAMSPVEVRTSRERCLLRSGVVAAVAMDVAAEAVIFGENHEIRISKPRVRCYEIMHNMSHKPASVRPYRTDTRFLPGMPSSQQPPVQPPAMMVARLSSLALNVFQPA